jgi:hypothetical protein
LVVAAIQYYLQFAYGQLRLHVLGFTFSASIQMPIMFYAAYFHGALGAGHAWFFLRLILFFVWVPVVHRSFAKGLHAEWLMRKVLPVAGAAFMGSVCASTLVGFLHGDRITLLLYLILQAVFVVGVSMLCIKGFVDLISVKYRSLIQ